MPVLAFSYPEHLSSAIGANSLGRWLTILHGNCLSIFHFPFSAAFHTVCLHLCLLFYLKLNLKLKLFSPVMSIASRKFLATGRDILSSVGSNCLLPFCTIWHLCPVGVVLILPAARMYTTNMVKPMAYALSSPGSGGLFGYQSHLL
jgi:hypothetical protein